MQITREINSGELLDITQAFLQERRIDQTPEEYLFGNEGEVDMHLSRVIVYALNQNSQFLKGLEEEKLDTMRRIFVNAYNELSDRYDPRKFKD